MVFSGPQKRTSIECQPTFFYYVMKIKKQKMLYKANKAQKKHFMKKISFIIMSIFLLTCSASAQIKEDIQKSKDRAAKLQTLCESYKTSGSVNIDGYGDAVKKAAAFAIANSVQLENLYKRQIGETEDGVTDVTIKKPTLEEWTALATTIAGEAASIKEATDKVENAANEAKSMTESASKEKNPMKMAKAAKKAKAATAIIEFGNAATPILLEESAAQAKAVKVIIETLKSGKNL